MNPQEVVWLNQVLPNWIPPIAGVKPPQTLDEIRVELRQSGSTLGEPIPLGSNTSVQDSKTPTSDVLIPILGRRSNCVTDCDHISALRVYQSVAPAANLQLKTDKTVRYQFVSQLAIAGPDEVFVIAPIVDARSGNQGSARSLPLTEIKRFEGAVPSTGVWLKLSGQWSRGNDTVKYGQVIRYNPQRFHLALLLDWTSPSGQDPVWQEVTGGGLPELIVNQTVGMEPHFQIYQVKPRNFLPNPIQLEPVSLLEAALDRSAYTDALQLARSGLWSTSEAWLKSLKHSGAWSAAAQAQLDLVKLHAQATKLQAENSWASPSEQILADLIDGRWNQALHVLEDSVENSQETIALLKSDSGQIRSRVEAALSTGSRDWEVKAWGALLIHAQKGPKAAIAWLKKQPQTTPADLTRIQRLMKTLS